MINGSTPLFNKYLKIAEDEDNKMAESWKADADEILIFVSTKSLLASFSHVLI